MGIVENIAYSPIVDDKDPDDYRPKSKLALVVDSSDSTGRYVKGLSFIFEKMAAGDAIPLHTHTLEEAIIIDDGSGEVTLGDEVRNVKRGTVVFVPPGVPHRTRNTGTGVLSLHAVFPSGIITIRYLGRNPAPGTEGQPPQPPFAIDVRKLLAGSEDAVRALTARNRARVL